MKVLIIGGSRFVGPVVLKLLHTSGHELTIFNRGTIDYKYPSGVHFVRGDRDKSFGLKQKFDVIIDMCAYNGSQTKRALKDLAFDYFINFGTVASYRQSSIFPLTEDFPIGDWPAFGNYNKGKVECEEVLKQSGVKYCTIRPVYILGPKNHRDREKFIYSRVMHGQALTLPGNGMSLTQFVFADEVASAIAALVEHQPRGAFNIAGDQAITLTGLVQAMGQIVGKSPVIKYDTKADASNFNEEIFPFMNENMLVSNQKIKQYGVTFIPLTEGLERDYKSYYKNCI